MPVYPTDFGVGLDWIRLAEAAVQFCGMALAHISTVQRGGAPLRGWSHCVAEEETGILQVYEGSQGGWGTRLRAERVLQLDSSLYRVRLRAGSGCGNWTDWRFEVDPRASEPEPETEVGMITVPTNQKRWGALTSLSEEVSTLVEKDLIPCTETISSNWRRFHPRNARRPPVPVPFMHFARGMTGRDGTPLTGPVPPVKTVTATIPRRKAAEGQKQRGSKSAQIALNLRILQPSA
ncbi:hypothetical protein B0H16DRAFT_1456772 [Mycena metata]|uniref:Uncharacterized protein n=1 Tax=Mycena metata TaxID=1033252 RepID=A0AAD7NF49_9AGAR|nr:hypothetical protein B0H16DRAFT_1456772 [Mycena metata]